METITGPRAMEGNRGMDSATFDPTRLQETRSPQVVAIVQARLGSTRFPRKVLQPIAGQPMLAWVVGRLMRCRRVQRVVVATTNEMRDRELVDYCHQRGWATYCGSEHDVLQRYLDAAAWSQAEVIVRITSDCPLIDPELVDDVVDRLLAMRGCDYVSNFHPERRYPRGLDCEAFWQQTLLRAAQLSDCTPRNREHVTLAIYENPHAFCLGEFSSDSDWSALRWTVDTQTDWQLVNAIGEWFGRDNFSWREVLSAYADNPHWLTLNNEILQHVA